MKKLQQELELVVGMDHMVEESHLHKLEYLNCVIVWSMVSTYLRIMVNIWAIGRDPNVWPNPKSFTPERFIGSNIDVNGHNFELLPFSSGRKGCPGMQLGLTEVKMMVAQMVHCFNWEIPKGLQPSDMDMSEHFVVITARAKNLMAIPSYRLANN
ncbi:hypothetical protein ACS0TY_025960 [Phlomoides rotata]